MQNVDRILQTIHKRKAMIADEMIIKYIGGAPAYLELAGKTADK